MTHGASAAFAARGGHASPNPSSAPAPGVCPQRKFGWDSFLEPVTDRPEVGGRPPQSGSRRGGAGFRHAWVGLPAGLRALRRSSGGSGPQTHTWARTWALSAGWSDGFTATDETTQGQTRGRAALRPLHPPHPWRLRPRRRRREPGCGRRRGLCRPNRRSRDGPSGPRLLSSLTDVGRRLSVRNLRDHFQVCADQMQSPPRWRAGTPSEGYPGPPRALVNLL